MGKGREQCGPCQPCGICGIPLQVGAMISAAFFGLEGTGNLGIILYDLIHSLQRTHPKNNGNNATATATPTKPSEDDPKVLDKVLLGIVAAVVITWIIVSVLLFIGALQRNRCLVWVFILGISVCSLVLFIVLVVAAFTRPADSDIYFYSLYVGYGYGFFWTLIQWYFFWVAYAFYLELLYRLEPQPAQPAAAHANQDNEAAAPHRGTSSKTGSHKNSHKKTSSHASHSKSSSHH